MGKGLGTKLVVWGRQTGGRLCWPRTAVFAQDFESARVKFKVTGQPQTGTLLARPGNSEFTPKDPSVGPRELVQDQGVRPVTRLGKVIR